MPRWDEEEAGHYSLIVGTMWPLCRPFTLLALSAGLCVALTSQQGEFPRRGPGLVHHVESEKTLACCIRLNTFSVSSQVGIVECEPVPKASVFYPQINPSVLHVADWTEAMWMPVPIWQRWSWLCRCFYFIFINSHRLKLNFVAQTSIYVRLVKKLSTASTVCVLALLVLVKLEPLRSNWFNATASLKVGNSKSGQTRFCRTWLPYIKLLEVSFKAEMIHWHWQIRLKSENECAAVWLLLPRESVIISSTGQIDAAHLSIQK